MKTIRSNDKNLQNAILVLRIFCVACFVSLTNSFFGLFLTTTYAEQLVFSNDFFILAGMLDLFIFWLLVVVEIVSIVFFVRWFWISYDNLSVIVRPNYAVSWSIAGWFVPVLSFFRPCQMMNELWYKTNKYLYPDSPSSAFQKTRSLIKSWWTVFIVCCILAQASLRFSLFSIDLIDESNSRIIINILLMFFLALYVSMSIDLLKAFRPLEEALYNQQQELIVEKRNVRNKLIDNTEE